MRIDTYKVCKQVANSLRSIVLAGNEINEVQVYSNDNFGENCSIYNQIANNKKSYKKPYIAVSEIGQNEKMLQAIQIDIDFAIPIDSVEEVTVDGVIEYLDYYKLSEFANIIIDRIESKGSVCYSSSQIVFRPNEISIGTNEYSGSINITYEWQTPISK